MKYLHILLFSLLFTAAAVGQSADISPLDLRYSSPGIYGPASIHYQTMGTENRGVLGRISEKPGYVFLASAAVPGLGQAANRQWWKTGLFLAVEAAAIGVYIHKENAGRSGERRYSSYANQKWSVVAYAQWLVDYNHEHGANLDVDLTDLANPGYEDAIENAAFDISIDWETVNLERLNELERNSRYYDSTNNVFSHHLEPYDSQQYYELISKYFQYGPGWKDWGPENSISGGIDGMTEYWLKHAQIGYRFNDDLSIARNMLNVLVLNHFVSAFDAYFTHLLRNNRVQASASVMRNGPELRLTYNF